MNIKEFIAQYRNHPVLFLGTGLSLRYLKNSFTWDGLLERIAIELYGNKEFYYDIKADSFVDGKYDFKLIATNLEKEFNKVLSNDRHGKFEYVNDEFYRQMEQNVNVSRFKIYISSLLKDLDYRDETSGELIELKKVRKNIGSIITTNYDCLIEKIFEFNPLIGNNILLSNPYGSLYKIHGCVTDPLRIIITDDDYNHFNEKYELIRAQLLSLFIHNPIIFLGYGIGDDNIKYLLKTIFTYIEPNTPEAEQIRSNFLLVEYQEKSDNLEVTDYDINMNGFATIRINKIKTDDFGAIYKELSSLKLPVSAMDIRKVQAVVKEIYTGGNIKVSITENLDTLKNDEKVIAIGSLRTIKYEYQTTSEMIQNYFDIIDEANNQLLALIDKHKIQKNQYFPIFGFSFIQSELESECQLKEQQIAKLDKILSQLPKSSGNRSIQDVLEDTEISATKEKDMIIAGVEENEIELEDLESYLRNYCDKKCTNYRKLICYYDFKKYGSVQVTDL